MNEASNALDIVPAAVVVPPDSGDYLEAETIQLTESVIANLAASSLTNISLFDFAPPNPPESNHTTAGECRTFPGDDLWPEDAVWDTLDLLTGGALIKTVPLASSCYDSWGDYDAEACAYITDQWTNSSLQ